MKLYHLLQTTLKYAITIRTEIIGIKIRLIAGKRLIIMGCFIGEYFNNVIPDSSRINSVCKVN